MGYNKNSINKYPKNKPVGTTRTTGLTPNSVTSKEISDIREKIDYLFNIINNKSNQPVNTSFIYTQDDFDKELFKQLKI